MSSFKDARDRLKSSALIAIPKWNFLKKANSRIYAPLLPNQIRLLTVTSRDKLELHLTTYDLDDCPEFHALSYTWGTSSKHKSILCNQHIVKIGANLHEALRTLYTPPVQLKLPIWVDAICIDQNDDNEKGHQIHHMGSIFRRANQVVVWLGPSEQDSNTAMEWMERLALALPNLPVIEKTKLELPLSLQGLPSLKHPLWQALGHLYRRKWFGRLWTFQEVVLAKNVMIVCGQYSIGWQNLLVVSKELRRLSLIVHCINYAQMEVFEDGFSAVDNMNLAMERLTNGERVSFFRLLAIAGDKLTLDARDTVFGMLGLASDVFRERIPISYAREAAQTFIDCTKACIEEEDNLRILQLIAGRVRDPGLPSWCPNLASSRGELWEFGSHLHAGTTKKVSQGLLLESRKINILPLNILSIAGFRVDNVDEIVEGIFPWSNSSDLQQRRRSAQDFLDWSSRCLEVARRTYAVQPEMVLMGHIFALTAITRARSPGETDESFFQSYLDILASFERLANDGLALAPPAARLLLYNDMWQQMLKACLGRRYFSTKGGRVGMGPPEMKPGDSVCVFYSAGPLYILRPTLKDGRQGWLLQGDAFVHGFMELDETPISDRGADEIFDNF